jgi:hypothetical protein
VLSPFARDSEKIKSGAGYTYLSGKQKGERIVEYGRAVIHGYLVNIGYSPTHGYSIISFRRDMSGIYIINKIAPTANK